MNEKEFCVVIKYDFLKGKTVKETKAEFDKHYDSSLLIWIVYNWFGKFRSGHMATGNF